MNLKSFNLRFFFDLFVKEIRFFWPVEFPTFWILLIAHSWRHFKKYIYLLGCAGSSLQHEGSFSCGMWNLVPWPGFEPGPPVLGAQSLSHWTTREVPWCHLIYSFVACITWKLGVISRGLVTLSFDYLGKKNSLVGVYFHRGALNIYLVVSFSWC